MKKIITCFFLLSMMQFSAAAYAAFDSAASRHEKELRIVRITPEGEGVPAGRQIVIEFNRAVVPLGKMERTKEEIPVAITPALECQWRWLNTSSLSCNLDEKNALKNATTYQVRVNPSIRAEDGATIAVAYQHQFTTERPAIRYTWFKTWSSPGTPVVRIVFNQPVTKNSVEQYFSFVPEDAKKKPTKLTAEADPYDREVPQIVPVPGENYFAIFKPSEPQKSDDQKTTVKGIEARRIWLVTPEEELPLNRSIHMVLAAGLTSALGPEKGLENKAVVRFDTYPEFAFIGIKCTANDGKAITVTPEKKQQAAELCNPLESIRLAFNSPVLRSQVKKQLEFNPPLPRASKESDPWGSEEDYSRLGRPYNQGETYDIWLPPLKAAKSYRITTKIPERSVTEKAWHWLSSIVEDQPETDLEDEFARQLRQPIDITLITDHRRPNFEIIHHEAVIEKGVDSDVPLYVNNLTQGIFDYRSISPAGEKLGQKRYDIPKVQDVQFAVPFGVRDMLNNTTGAVYGKLITNPVVSKYGYRAHRLFAVVTPYQLHVKLGHFSSLVWVTDLVTGDVVSDAKVTVYKDAISRLSQPQKPLAASMTDAEGVAILPGTKDIDPELDITDGYSHQNPDDNERLFIRVDKGPDMAVMPLSSDFMIDTWRASGEAFYHYSREKYGHMLTWGTTAQGVYRAGDTMQYKFYVRDQDDRGLIPAPPSGYTLEIIDPTDKVLQEVNHITLSEFGAYSGEFAIPKQAAVGWYQFRLTSHIKSEDGKEHRFSWYPIRVLVSDFTLVPFKVTNELNGDLFQAGQKVEVTTAAKLHSGGAYTDATARITALLQSRPFTSRHPLAQAFTFASYTEEKDNQQIYQKIEKLNDKGELDQTFSLPEQNVLYGKLLVESAVQDDRGKYVAASSTADYVGVDRFVGLHATQWLYHASEPAEIEYLVVDAHGTPVSGTEADVKIQHQVTNAARVKGAGNAYLTNFTTSWEDAATCHGMSENAALVCAFTPKDAGTYRAVASIKDTKGRPHTTEISFWVVGKDYVLWDEKSDSYLQIMPEKTEYKVGDTARYMIKNPYPGAKALVTIERYGVIDQFVQTLDSSTPVIEFPVKPDYLPGFYLSVVVDSPRVDKPLGKGQVDLGKPAFRIGYLSVPVKDQHKEMQVTIQTDKETYRPREDVHVSIHAEPRFAAETKEPIELAVAVLDEAVFDLVTGGKTYFDPYQGFHQLENLDVRNYSLLMRLIGRQKFEKKGANPGGDGGSDLSMRNLFKFVSYWNPSIKTDAKGNADITFPVPDNLTGWRVLVLAVTPSDRMGLGDGNFKVNRPTEIRPVMPNQVTEGDAFRAGFSVMNRTDKKRSITVTIDAAGTIKQAGHYQETVTLEPYKRATVYMPIETSAVDVSQEQGKIHFIARAADAQDADGVEHDVPVEKMRSLETAANYGTTLSDRVEESVAFPEKIHTDVGKVSVVVSPSVIGNVEGAFRYLKTYPYNCWEQRLTKGVMAAHYIKLQAYMPSDFLWDDAAALPQETLNSAANFQAPNGGMTYFVPEDRYVDPYLSAYTALAFHWLREAGYQVPDTVEAKLQDYLQGYLRHNVAPEFYSEGMNTTIRAVALAALAAEGKITKEDIARYQPYVSQMSLFGKTHFLQAAMAVGGEELLVKDVAKQILAHANQSGGKFIFSEELDDSYSRVLASPLRENCAILDTFTALGERKEGGELVQDIPFKLVRAITQTRKNRDHWENTQENMFCMKALSDYAGVYENVTPQMTVTASMDKKTFGKTRLSDVKDKAVTFERPVTAEDPGRKTQVVIDRKGQGRLYYATRLSYAPLDEVSQSINAGMEIHREYSVERDGKWILLENPAQIKRGELVRVDIFLSLPAARNFVVVNDPVPGGLEPVNRDLANASVVDADKGKFEAAGGSWWFKFNDWIGYNVSRWSFYHQELRHDAVRFYADYLPAGNYHLSYTAQAIAEGNFAIQPVQAEEMYDPDVFGKDKAGHLNVANQ